MNSVDMVIAQIYTLRYFIVGAVRLSIGLRIMRLFLRSMFPVQCLNCGGRNLPAPCISVRAAVDAALWVKPCPQAQRAVSVGKDGVTRRLSFIAAKSQM